jgi:hypothetical protein
MEALNESLALAEESWGLSVTATKNRITSQRPLELNCSTLSFISSPHPSLSAAARRWSSLTILYQK